MERDFPINHPAASDYDGTPYNPPRAPYGEDFPEGHPARDGKNVSALDTPDGLRAAVLHQQQDFEELASVGALPALFDPDDASVISLVPKDHAYLYAYKKGLLPDATSEEATKQALDILVHRGYSIEVAQALLDRYCVPASAR